MRLLLIFMCMSPVLATEWVLKERFDKFGWDTFDMSVEHQLDNEIQVFKRAGELWDPYGDPIHTNESDIIDACLSHDAQALAVLVNDSTKRVHTFFKNDTWLEYGRITMGHWGNRDAIAFNGNGTSLAYLNSYNDEFKVHVFDYKNSWRRRGRSLHNRGKVRLHSIHMNDNATSVVIDSRAVHRILQWKEHRWVYTAKDSDHRSFSSLPAPVYQITTYHRSMKSSGTPAIILCALTFVGLCYMYKNRDEEFKKSHLP